MFTLFVCPSNYLNGSKRICIKIASDQETIDDNLGNIRIMIRIQDPDYYPHTGSVLRSGYMIQITIRIQDSDYDPDAMDLWWSSFEVPAWKITL